MRIRKAVTMLLAAMMALIVPLSAFPGCSGDPEDETSGGNRDYTEELNRTFTPTLSVSSDRVEIGVEDVQKWVFVKSDSNWLFDGVYAIDEGESDKVFTGSSGRLDASTGLLAEDGYYFTVQSSSDENGLDKSVNGMVTNISVVKDEKNEKSVSLTGKGFESTLTVYNNSQFVERKISIEPAVETAVREGDISFVLRGKVDEYSEYGYILSRKTDDSQYSLPYSFPALAGKLTRLQDSSKVFTYINVIDYYDTSASFKTARRRVGLNNFFEEGILSSEGTLYADQENNFVERVCVRSGDYDSFYDLIYDARYEYGQLYDLDVEKLITMNSNMNVYDWDEAVYGATYDIIDSRGRPLGDDVGAWGPYGYQNGGAESFGSMNMLKGMIRYAMATDDQELYDFAMKYLLQMVTPDPVYGKCYVMPLNRESAYSQYHGDYFFFLSCFDGGRTYTAVDTYMGADAQNFGAFKYYSRVSQLGELAILTDNATLKTAYLNLMTLVKRLKLDDFSQPVEWGHDGQPKLDYENGGSSGAEAMWANCMYIASLITEDEEEKALYLDYMQKATDLANKQGFTRSSSLRDAPKPESSGYLARMNIVLYERTGDKSYLNYALTAAQGIYFFYFHNTHPYTYFQTLGYGYACAHERWEAFMEMVESLELLSCIFEYTNDPMMYELYLTLRESALSTLPVNGYPEGVLGGHSDWLDALYVPFEQPTGVVGDNGLADGGASSYRRWSKEQYGMGEIYLGALMYSTQGKAADPAVLVLNYTATWLHSSRTNNSYKVFNFGDSGDKVIAFPNYDDGVYTIAANGKSLGNYTAEQMANGIAIHLEKEKPVNIEIKPSEQSANAAAVDKDTSVSILSSESDSAKIEINAQGASYYRLYVSRTADFNEYTTSSKFSEKNTFELGFADSTKLYVRAVAYDKNGNAYNTSEPVIIQSKDVNIGVQDDYASCYLTNEQSQEGWTAKPTYYKGAISFGTDLGDFIDYPTDTEKYRDPTGYMAVYKPAYAGYDIDTFTKTYTVDISEYPLFDFYPFTKNFGSQFSLKVDIGGKQYTLLDKIESFDSPNYRFNLQEITGLTGEQDVKVIIVSEGFNRGFALTKLRFVNETDYNAGYDLTSALEFTGTAEADNENGMLTITNGEGMATSNEFVLPQFDPSEYQTLEILLSGITTEQNGFLKATVKILDGETEVYSKMFSGLLSNSTIAIPLSGDGAPNLSADKQYRMEFEFRIVNTEVDNVQVKTIRLTSSDPDNSSDGFDPEKGYVPVVTQGEDGYELTNGWGSNWAFANTADGYIENRNPNVGYASIYKSGILLDLDETPVIRFTVSQNKNNTSWELKANDGTMANDLSLQTGSGTGTFEVNLKDAFGRAGIINLRLDFYVVHDMTSDGSKGVYFEGYAFLKGTELYSSIIEGAYSETVSSEFTLNTDKTNYLILDIPELTYGSTWLVYLVDENGNEYELKTVYESVYSKMYSRKKEGVFKYQLTDVLPASLLGTDAKFTLKIVLSGEDSSVIFGSIRLANDNDTLVLQEACKIR